MSKTIIRIRWPIFTWNVVWAINNSAFRLFTYCDNIFNIFCLTFRNSTNQTCSPRPTTLLILNFRSVCPFTQISCSLSLKKYLIELRLRLFTHHQIVLVFLFVYNDFVVTSDKCWYGSFYSNTGYNRYQSILLFIREAKIFANQSVSDFIILLFKRSVMTKVNFVFQGIYYFYNF